MIPEIKIEYTDDLIVLFGYVIEEALQTKKISLDEISDAFEVAWEDAVDDLRNKGN